ncbi:MAG: hypothetical protein K1X28_09685 [Parachlamydiales bacterium]|nr:hypothetical protein [Parachlamydiales bacterium]
MKKLKTILALMTLLCGGTLQAQATGDTAVQTVKTVKANNWQNWAFAGSMLLTAAGAIFVVSMHNGNESSSTSH